MIAGMTAQLVADALMIATRQPRSLFHTRIEEAIHERAAAMADSGHHLQHEPTWQHAAIIAEDGDGAPTKFAAVMYD
jgi:hypothetical protein